MGRRPPPASGSASWSAEPLKDRGLLAPNRTFEIPREPRAAAPEPGGQLPIRVRIRNPTVMAPDLTPKVASSVRGDFANDREDLRPPSNRPLVDHVRGPEDAPLLVEYGDYECPYSRRAFREIERVERTARGRRSLRVPALPAHRDPPARAGRGSRGRGGGDPGPVLGDARALFHRQKALEDDDLRRYARDSGSTWSASTRPGERGGLRRASAETSRAAGDPARCTARRPCSSNGSSTAAATTRPR